MTKDGIRASLFFSDANSRTINLASKLYQVQFSECAFLSVLGKPAGW